MEHRSLSPQTLAAQALGETDPATGALAPVITMSTPAVICGSQSKVTSPMVTDAPGSAPSRTSSCSTPSRAKRSAR